MSKCKYQIWSEWRFCSKTVTHLSIPKSTSFSQHKLTVLVSCNVTTPPRNFHLIRVQFRHAVAEWRLLFNVRQQPSLQDKGKERGRVQHEELRAEVGWRLVVQQQPLSAGESERHLCDGSECAVGAWHQVASHSSPRPQLLTQEVKNEDFTKDMRSKIKRTTVICMTFSYCI